MNNAPSMVRVPHDVRRHLKRYAAVEDCPLYQVIERLLREEDVRQAERQQQHIRSKICPCQMCGAYAFPQGQERVDAAQS